MNKIGLEVTLIPPHFSPTRNARYIEYAYPSIYTISHADERWPQGYNIIDVADTSK